MPRPENEISQTGSGTIEVDEFNDSATRTIAELLDDIGFLRNRTKILVEDSVEVHSSTEQLHNDSLATLHRTTSLDRAKQGTATLLEELSDLGFSWTDIGRLVGVSVPALRKWRLGGSSKGENRKRLADLVALCDIAREQYLIDDVASWLETPIHNEAPVTTLDLVAEGRFDLALRLASEQASDADSVLDDFDPMWRQRHQSAVEVFTAPDGIPGLRLREERP